MAKRNYRRVCRICGHRGGRKIGLPAIGKMRIRCPKCRRWGQYEARPVR